MSDYQHLAATSKSFYHDTTPHLIAYRDTVIIDASSTYERLVSHVTLIKLSNNYYKITVTLKFSLSTSENTIKMGQKYIYIFVDIKLIEPSAFIIPQNITVYYHRKYLP